MTSAPIVLPPPETADLGEAGPVGTEERAEIGS
jgi:hypothetical protein